ncbi:MAG TPA: Gfo/Idh/MocA family oxidoreductase [Fermentimonas sp.]|nr:Gfo/Idh/MocA family oxidoreductase [Fermentimonas sp.]
MINWGFIGCGSVAEVKSGPAFNKIEGSKVVAVMRRSGEKARDYAQRHGINKWYDNAHSIINDTDVNALYIATPPGSHAEYAIAAMKAGKPVYIEKPMAASYDECLEINRVSEETGIPCFVAYYRRTLPYFLKVKELIDSIGKVLTIQVSFAIPPYDTDYDKENLPWRVKKEIAGAGYFYDLASHQLDLLDFLFGEISEVNGFAQNIAELYDVEDTVTASFRFNSGALGSGSWSFVAPKDSRTDRIYITGTEGVLSFSTFDFSPIIYETPNGKKEYEVENPENIQFFLIKDIVNYLNGEGELPVSTGKTAIRTNYVMDKILGEI